MSTTQINNLDLIDRLIQENNLSSALEELNKINPDSLDKAGRALFNLLLAESKIFMGDCNVKDMVISALEHYRLSSENNLYTRARYIYGLYLVSIGDFIDAKEALIESYLYHKRFHNYHEIQRILNRLAYVQFQSGAIDDAVNNLMESITINEKLKNDENVCLQLRNLATIYIKVGKLRNAIDLFSHQKSLLISQKTKNVYSFYLRNAIAVALQGNIKEAIKIISKTTLISDDFKREKAIYYEYLGWIYNLDGKFKEAVNTLKTGIKLSMKIAPESALISQTKRLLTDAYIGLGKFDKAQKTAEEALVVAEKINERVEIAGCYRVFAQVATHNGEHEKAREWYRKACEIFALIQSKYELAATRYLMAISGLYENGERSALLYMARDYFISEDVKPYITKVDQAIKGAPKLPVGSTEERKKHAFIAVHPKTKKIVELAENIAPADMTVLLTGPTGCGKDQLARYIHACSGRKGQFVSINSAAIPDSMVESELFGYKKGAFTGADKDKAGLFELANNGTFYLNEIADSTPAFQAKLLEIIEIKTVRRLGDGHSRKINIRIIAATNHNLEKRIREGEFRLDLYHRLNEIPITLPPLSERPDDIPPLVKHFLAGYKFNGNLNENYINTLCQHLTDYDWADPDSGNVRELKTLIDRLYIMADGDLRSMISQFYDYGRNEKNERDLLVKTLKATKGNQREAARILGISEGSIRYRIKKYNIKKEDYDNPGA